MRPHPALVIAPFMLAAAAAAATEAPVVRCRGEHAATVLTLLPAVLNNDAIRSRLDSGLTNSLLFRLTFDNHPGAPVTGGGRIDIRYELWDEEYLINSFAGDGTSSSESVASFDQLEHWWRQLELVVLPPAALAPKEIRHVEVELSFVPFSQSEQLDAQLWFTRSLGTGAGSERVSGTRAEPESMLDLLVATSITRRSLLRYTWTVPLITTGPAETEEEAREQTET